MKPIQLISTSPAGKPAINIGLRGDTLVIDGKYYRLASQTAATSLLMFCEMAVKVYPCIYQHTDPDVPHLAGDEDAWQDANQSCTI